MMPSPPDSPTIETVVAVIGSGVDEVFERLVPITTADGNSLLIVHQLVEDTDRLSRPLPDRVRYVAAFERGLARSRNVGVELAESDVVVLADDDSVFLPGAFERIRAAYRRHPDAAAITFRTETDERWPDDFVHSWRTVGQVYSLLITYRPQWLRDQNISFDERFGLGAEFPQGEDNILLADIRRAGGEVIGCPERIIPFPGLTSGDVFTPDQITTKVVVARRMYGWWGGIGLAIAFVWTKRHLYRAQGVSLLGYLRAARRGLATDV